MQACKHQHHPGWVTGGRDCLLDPSYLSRGLGSIEHVVGFQVLEQPTKSMQNPVVLTVIYWSYSKASCLKDLRENVQSNKQTKQTNKQTNKKQTDKQTKKHINAKKKRTNERTNKQTNEQANKRTRWWLGHPIETKTSSSKCLIILPHSIRF